MDEAIRGNADFGVIDNIKGNDAERVIDVSHGNAVPREIEKISGNEIQGVNDIRCGYKFFGVIEDV